MPYIEAVIQQGSGGGEYQSKIAPVDKIEQVITADNGYAGLSDVTVGPIILSNTKVTCKPVLSSNTWTQVNWDGLTNFDGNTIWSDNTNIYNNSCYIVNSKNKKIYKKIF